MGITRIRANTQIKQGTVDSFNVKDRSLIPEDFAVYPQVPTSMTTAQRDAIQNPPPGLMIYNTNTLTLDFFNGVQWLSFVTTADVVWDGGNASSEFDQAVDGGNA
jgi:hypothetical protein